MGPVYKPYSDYAIGVDVGGTKINAGIVRDSGEVLHRVVLPTLAGKAEVVRRVYDAIDGLLHEAGKRKADWLQVRGIGIGTAGQVDWADGSIRFANDLLPGYTGTPLKRLVRERYGVPVCVDNDVNVLALTERKLGVFRGARYLLCLALGTGIGGAVIAEGRLLHGAWGGAGEFGHISVDFRGAPCICGGFGCLEQYVSGTGIASRMRERLAALGVQKPPDLDARQIIARWQNGDPASAAVMEEACAALGSAIASLAHTFNPEGIVLGGGVAEAGKPFFDRIREETAKRGMPSFLRGVRIEPAYRGSWSGLIGAALQMWEAAEEGGGSAQG